MKILLLGGSGAMGIHLTKLLSDDGYEVFITSRSPRESIGNKHYLLGNAQELIFLQSILQKKWDVIIDFMIYTTISFEERVNLLLNSTLHYVFLSSSRVYSGVNHLITEKTPLLLDSSLDVEYLSSDEYALTKARQENILKKAKHKNWTIIRPYITYSESRMQLGTLEKEEWLFRALHGRTIVFSSEIFSKTTTLTYGFDVANAIKAIIGNPATLNETYHITASQSRTWENIAKIYLDILEIHLGCRPKILLLSTDEFHNFHFAKYQILYDRLYDRNFDNAKIGALVDVNSFLNATEGLNRCLKDFLQKPDFKHIDWKMEAEKDRITKEHTPLHQISNVKNIVKYIIYRYLIN